MTGNRSRELQFVDRDRGLLEALKHTMPVRIQNVAEYLNEQDDLDLKWEKDFPNNEFAGPRVRLSVAAGWTEASIVTS
jgi:hypothetical protein